ncbi:MAG: hypothetical protein ACRESU_07185 [Gammaproteobacteria bacterium]
MRNPVRTARYALLVIWITLAASVPALADNFASVHYVSLNDSLVVTIEYRGTNPDHRFSIGWGKCRPTQKQGLYQIAARILDDQWQDAALHNYQKTVHFSLDGLRCRPARVTLYTAPKFRYTILVPVSGKQ